MVTMNEEDEKMEFPKIVEISVTQSDIDAGERRCTSNCPIALAAIRAFKLDDARDYIVSVGIEYILILGNLPWAATSVRYLIPDMAQRFIAAFDDAPGHIPHPIEPFQFFVMRDNG